MTDKPIIFSPEMVRALLDGAKTQTRRILKPQPPAGSTFFAYDIGKNGFFARFLDEHEDGNAELPFAKIGAMKGDRLWVRENFQAHSWAADCVTIRYFAEVQTKGFTDQIEQIKYPEGDKNAFKYIAPKGPNKWRPSIHMPRWASRITLTVTDVRVQRLHDIAEDDARSEGPGYVGKASGEVCESIASHRLGIGPRWRNARDWFADLWDEINGPDAWDQNPWVVAYTFTVQKRNIDQCA